MKHVTYLHNNEEVLSLRKYRIVVVDILKLNDDSCISKKWTKRGFSLERFSFAFTSNGKGQAAACRKSKKIILF